MPDVITDLAQVTPRWLTSVLHENGYLHQGKVISVHNRLTKTLALSVVARLELQFSADAAASVPSSLFLKISRPDLPQALASELQGKEVEFYKAVAHVMPDPPFIRCYEAAYSPDSGRIHLLLDDLSETHFQTEPPLTPAQSYCELAVDCLIELHAYWWEHPRLGKDIGTLFAEQELKDFISATEKNIIKFIDFLGDKLSARQRKAYERILASSHQPWKHLTGAKRLTVIHGDAHWWNFLYPRDTSQYRTCMFDWSLWHIDMGARDLAFMMALGWDRERRAASELNLLRRYYDGLLAHGIENYTWDDCLNDYRWSVIRNLNVPAIQWSHGRSPSLWWSNLERAMMAYEDLGCSELLGT
ncbi:MAG: hypothetical protein QOH25_4028 [Acidobacteriota bacterium]|jgi:hypothetical protein|nr:hypothetical protein [Acidobacteriota bacterium]